MISTVQFEELIKSNPELALKSLYDDYYVILCHNVHMILRDSVIAEDIVQEVFMAIWRKRDELSIQISLEGYLKRACRNRALNYIRDNSVRWEDESELDSLRAKGYESDTILEAEDLTKNIQKEIDQLPEKCRIVFSMSRFEEMTYNEIANHLNISVKTVENQISKALKILRERIFLHVVN